MKRILLLIVGSIILSSNLYSQSGKVIKVKDGDTIVILDNEFVQYTIRVADIDCPEKSQPFGNKAKQFTSTEIYGRYVEIDKKSIDKYGRIIGSVLYENKNLSLELLKNGLAWHYKYFSDDVEMAKIENIAKQKKIGLWIDTNPINPYNWRKGMRK